MLCESVNFSFEITFYTVELFWLQRDLCLLELLSLTANDPSNALILAPSNSFTNLYFGATVYYKL